jgi:hypothetical protein
MTLKVVRSELYNQLSESMSFLRGIEGWLESMLSESGPKKLFPVKQIALFRVTYPNTHNLWTKPQSFGLTTRLIS